MSDLSSFFIPQFLATIGADLGFFGPVTAFPDFGCIIQVDNHFRKIQSIRSACPFANLRIIDT